MSFLHHQIYQSSHKQKTPRMWGLYYWDVLSQTDHIDQTTNKKRNNPTKYPRYCGEILSQRFFIKVCHSSSSDCVSLGFEFSFCILKYMKPAIRTTVITIASVGIFIIISSSKSTKNYPQKMTSVLPSAFSAF